MATVRRAGAPFRHTGAALVRATTDPGGLTVPEDLDLSAAPAVVVERGMAWLAGVWRRPQVRHAIAAASPVLAWAIEAALTGPWPEASKVRRLVLSLVGYLLRWHGRATPFGLFGGVGPVQVGGEPAAWWGEEHQAVARGDAEWLAALVCRLEDHAGLRERLPVAANRSVFRRGDRVVIPGAAPDGQPGVFAPLEVSVRATGPVRLALDAAGEPMRFHDLVKTLVAEYPHAALGQIRALLAELVEQQFLLTSLRASMTTTDALQHLCDQLDAVDADNLPELASELAELRCIRDALARHNEPTTFPVVAASIRKTLSKRMNAVQDEASRPLLVDVALDSEVTLPRSVITEAEAAASTLLRLTPYPSGYAHWRDFHLRFQRRYGAGAVIPLQEVVADSGLGLPAGYLGSAVRRTPRLLTPRDEALIALVQRAMLDGETEIEVTEQVLRALTVEDSTDMVAPGRVELAFQVHAASADAVRRGAFRVVVTAVPRPGSSMAGRFTDLLPDAERTRWAASYAASDHPDTVAAQLSFPPRQRRSENVARTPQLLPATIALSEHHPPHENLIDLADLAVHADTHDLRLIQLSTRRRVEPRVLHALEAGTFTPPLARFLAEITTARRAVYAGFDWGAAASLPYLPRVVSGRAVLSQARWLLTTTDLPQSGAASPEWDTALVRWRRRWHAPAGLVLCEDERRLPLDLDHPLHRAVLHTRLDRAGQVELREAPTGEDLGFVGRAHEVLIALRAASQPLSGARSESVACTPTAASAETAAMPGASVVVLARIGGHPDRQNEILTEHLPALFQDWSNPPQWWFTRRRDLTRPDQPQHLDLHLRVGDHDLYGEAVARLGEWATDLRDAGLVPDLQLATYHAQPGRYGHGAALAAAHEVFTADSVAALAQLALTTSGALAEAVTAASLFDLAVSYTKAPVDGRRWLIDQLPHERGPQDRSLRDTALRLADPSGNWATLRAQPGGERLLLAWEHRRAMLAAYRTALAAQRDPDPVLRSLLHGHHVRAIGVDPDRERLTHRLARAAAQRRLAHDGSDR